MKIKLITFLYLLCSTSIAVGNSKYGDGTGAIFMDELQCSGSESSLGDCQFDGYGQHDCDHTEDAGVICNAGEYLWYEDKQLLSSCLIMCISCISHTAGLIQALQQK